MFVKTYCTYFHFIAKCVQVQMANFGPSFRDKNKEKIIWKTCTQMFFQHFETQKKIDQPSWTIWFKFSFNGQLFASKNASLSQHFDDVNKVNVLLLILLERVAIWKTKYKWLRVPFSNLLWDYQLLVTKNRKWV